MLHMTNLNSNVQGNAKSAFVKNKIQRVIPLTNVRWVEYNHAEDSIKLMYINGMDEVYKNDDKDVHESVRSAKSVFYDIIRETKVETKIIEW